MRKFLFTLSLILSCGFMAPPASAQEVLFQPESSFPGKSMPLEVPLKESLQKTIRVKVFPHDLKSDWVHGTPDNPKKVSLTGAGFSINQRAATKADLSLQDGKLLARLDNGIAFTAPKMVINSSRPIKVEREKNLSRSHSYSGSLEVFVKNGKIQVVNHLDIESYLKGVVPKEAIHTWPLEALKAQAVAARSYAYYHLLTSSGKDYDVDDTARYQVYAGQSAQTASTDKAIEETKGEVLTHNGNVIVAFFHAYSGGRTDSAKNIFGSAAAYCQSKEEIFPRNELKQELPVNARWIVEWQTKWQNKHDLLALFKRSSHSSSSFSLFSLEEDYQASEQELHPKFDSVKTLKFTQNENKTLLDFKTVRKVIGWAKFHSYHYRLKENSENQIAFQGHGWGHHVGLSQWGAFIMAKNYGRSYEEILGHYYTNVKIQTL